MTHWATYVLPFAVGFFSGWIAHMFASRRDRRNACAQFRAEFEPVLVYMRAELFTENNPVANCATTQDRCIGMFRGYVPWYKRRRFRRDCEAYRDVRFFAINQHQMLVYTEEVTQNFIRATERLLSYAK